MINVIDLKTNAAIALNNKDMTNINIGHKIDIDVNTDGKQYKIQGVVCSVEHIIKKQINNNTGVYDLEIKVY